MLNSDKAHIYKVLELAKCRVLALNQPPASFAGLLIHPTETLSMVVNSLQFENHKSILRNMALFKSELIIEIEGCKDVSYDSVLLKVETKCKEWQTLIM